MQHRGFWVIGSIVFGGVALGLAALAGTHLPEQNTIARTPFQPGVRTHTTFGEWTPEVRVPNASESAVELEAVSRRRRHAAALWRNGRKYAARMVTYWMSPRMSLSAITWMAITTWMLAT